MKYLLLIEMKAAIMSLIEQVEAENPIKINSNKTEIPKSSRSIEKYLSERDHIAILEGLLYDSLRRSKNLVLFQEEAKNQKTR